MEKATVVLALCCLATWNGVEAVVSGGTVKRSAPSRFNLDHITPANRTYCPTVDGNIPAERVNTTERLKALREEMWRAHAADGGYYHIDAYIIQYGDQHMSGGVAYDKRLEYISGFSGSNGFAIVLPHKAALWTDGRYFTQADLEMDCNWILMKQDTEGYPTGPEWVYDQLTSGSWTGAAPQLTSISTWQDYEAVARGNFLEVTDELIDRIWTTDREERPNNDIYEHTVDFAGEEWTDKLARVRAAMTTDVLVITALDETAWLFNLRGSDYPTSPLFYSYGMVMKDEVRLYLVDPTEKISGLLDHLNTNADGSCTDKTGECVDVRDYDDIRTDLENLTSEYTSISVSPSSSYAIYSSAGSRRRTNLSPIQLIKSIKNEVEKRRYFECQVRDSSYLIEFMQDLEKRVEAGEDWTELSAAEKLTQTRSQDPDYRMNSFDSISAVGSNAAIIHYRPGGASNARITTSDVYLLDSGGNYLDGTTDVTRTFHFGTPKAVEIEAYTRVLMGAIDLAVTVWPEGLLGSQLDARTRTPLWQNGWDYKHGTGHGIGYFLNVHEGPGRIAMGYNEDHSPLYAGMFFSDEPGYYEVGEYGIRLETIVGVVEADVPNKFDDKTYLTFRPATLVPFEPKLIDYNMLNQQHRQYLNAYNERCRNEVGELLRSAGKMDAVAWLEARTEHIPDQPNWSVVGGASHVKAWGLSVILGLLVSILL